jgi:hypothetical protein
MIDRQILQLLQTSAIAAVAASTLPTLPIKAMGRTFTIPNDQKYLELVHIPNNRQGDFWDNSKVYRGIFRLLLHWPIDDVGDYPPMNLLQSIAAPLDKDAILVDGSISVKIYENPDFSGVVEAGTDRIFGVSIWYQSFNAG